MYPKKKTKKISSKASKKTAKKTTKKKTRKKSTRRKRRSSKKPSKWLPRFFVLTALLVIGFVIYLDYTVTEKFEGGRWAIPAHVYTRPLELHSGAVVSKAQLIEELNDLGYREQERINRPGTYSIQAGAVDLYVRAFTFWDGLRPAAAARVLFGAGGITSVTDDAGKPVKLLRLEPRLFGSISPATHEDRSVVRLSTVPKQLIEALLAMEDRNFYQHIGIDPRGLLRAAWVNLSSGSLLQGGSTLTQQLVKNFYLTQERTLQRKLTELIMALLLEFHYGKNEILEAYINEVYLGQSGNRAIHGFGLASLFYFGRPLNELRLQEVALLVGLAKGASFYNPRRNPERALQRRNLVINKMQELGFIDPSGAVAAKKRSLGVTETGAVSATAYPAYLDFVRRQLQRDYQAEDLRSGGLRIFTTLDLRVQQTVENAVASRLRTIEQASKLERESLQAAVLVVSSKNGEVQALVGDRRPRFAGFNRALDAERPVGSLIKPAVFLGALEAGYTLASMIDDGPLTVKQRGASVWKPQNYDRRFHGQVRLIDALARSYNVATARLGLDMGVDNTIAILHRLGLSRDMDPYPSLFLGAVNMTPIEMAQMYLSFANGGYRTALRSTRSVLTQDQQPLARYPLNLERVLEPETADLVNFALQQVVRSGTARNLNPRFDAGLGLAGKTGTTDGLRDSWFAGFSGNYLTVVWVGRDDNKPTKLTGASGAMQIWADIMSGLNLQPLPIPESPTVLMAEIDQQGRWAAGCRNAERMPFLRGTVPLERAPCATGGPKPRSRGIKAWFKRLFKREEDRNK